MTQATTDVLIAAGALVAFGLVFSVLVVIGADRRCRRLARRAEAVEAIAGFNERRQAQLERELPDWDWPNG